jgi:hypothetical protein
VFVTNDLVWNIPKIPGNIGMTSPLAVCGRNPKSYTQKIGKFKIPKANTFTKKSLVISMLIRCDDVMKLSVRLENDWTGLCIDWARGTSYSRWGNLDLRIILCKECPMRWSSILSLRPLLSRRPFSLDLGPSPPAQTNTLRGLLCLTKVPKSLWQIHSPVGIQLITMIARLTNWFDYVCSRLNLINSEKSLSKKKILQNEKSDISNKCCFR